MSDPDLGNMGEPRHLVLFLKIAVDSSKLSTPSRAVICPHPCAELIFRIQPFFVSGRKWGGNTP